MICALALALSTHHFDEVLNDKQNEMHPSAICTIEQFDAGVYYNSKYQLSWFTSYDFGFVEIGAVTGYIEKPVPFARFKRDYENHTSFVTLWADEELENFGTVIGVQITIGETEL